MLLTKPLCYYSGYDLLDPSLEDNAKALEDLPKVLPKPLCY
jgi:hypothetical protein